MTQQSSWVLTDDSKRLEGGQAQPFYHLCKRLIDLVGACGLLIILGPLMLLIALVVKLDSLGPALFIQDRVGARRRRRHGVTSWDITTFRCYKFRSMTHHADSTLHRQHIKAFVEGTLEGAETDQARFKIVHDPRITRAGHYLRQTSLDELPQLFNVIRGNMSLVGPRPVPLYEAEQYQDWHHSRLAALPGITGYWQLKGRGSSTSAQPV